MEAQKPQIVTVAGYAIQPVDMSITMSNVINMICDTNRRPTLLRPFDVETLTTWRSLAISFAEDEHMSKLMKMLAAGDRSATPIQLFLEQYAPVAARLISEPRYEQDAGGALRAALLTSGHWSEMYVTSPSLGYPRGYLKLDTPFPDDSPPFDLPAWDGPKGATASTTAEPSLDFRDAMALMCQLFDRPALSDVLVPEAKNLVARDSKEPYFGQAKAALLQAEHLTSLGLMWQRQADAFALRAHASLWKVSYDLAYALFPRERPSLEYYDKLRSAAIAAVPCHPVLESIANMLNSVSMQTIYGDKAVAVRHGRHPGTSAVGAGAEPGRRMGPAASALASHMVIHAGAEAARMRALTAAGEAWPAAWAANVAPELHPQRISSLLGTPSTGSSFGELMEWVSKMQAYTRHWPDIARKLGWGGALSARPIDIMSAAADFVLTDGDGYSADPVAVLAGMRPGLSLGNIAAAGARVRFDPDFGTGPEIDESGDAADGGEKMPVAFRWSTVTVRGHLSAVDAVHTFTRFYMPIGMLMGEQGAEVKFIGAEDTDYIGHAVQAFYRERSPSGFIKQWYGPAENKLSRIAPDGTYLRTSWEAQAESAQPGAAQALMIVGYGKVNVDKSPITVFAFRDAWNMRIPARMARPNYFEWYNEIGGLVDIVPYGGSVVFNDRIDLPFSADTLMAFTDLLRITAPQIPSPATDEVKAPEGAGTA